MAKSLSSAYKAFKLSVASEVEAKADRTSETPPPKS